MFPLFVLFFGVKFDADIDVGIEGDDDGDDDFGGLLSGERRSDCEGGGSAATTFDFF